MIRHETRRISQRTDIHPFLMLGQWWGPEHRRRRVHPWSPTDCRPHAESLKMGSSSCQSYPQPAEWTACRGDFIHLVQGGSPHSWACVEGRENTAWWNMGITGEGRIKVSFLSGCGQPLRLVFGTQRHFLPVMFRAQMPFNMHHKGYDIHDRYVSNSLSSL